jgi:hypothetical protein
MRKVVEAAVFVVLAALPLSAQSRVYPQEKGFVDQPDLFVKTVTDFLK